MKAFVIPAGLSFKRGSKTNVRKAVRLIREGMNRDRRAIVIELEGGAF